MTCASCGQPTAGTYRCADCTRRAETSTQSNRARRSSGGSSVRHSPFLFPLATLVAGWTRATDEGRIPRWLTRTVLLLLAAWIVFLFVLGFTH
jgi:hypothetical protein